MIITKVMGGVGNQLFQWAVAKSLEIDNNIKSYLDVSFYNNMSGSTPRRLQLNEFPNLKYNILQELEGKIIQIVDDFNYRDIIYNNGYNLYLNGYWQSERYFKHNEDVIREQLIPSNDIQFKLIEKYPDLLKKSVSLHIRRTDYVNQQHNHPLQPIEYYYEAIKQIGDYDIMYIFSDEPEWCKHNLNFKNSIVVSNDSDQEDIWHMSMCKHNIIANSSFSWWGAWLNSNPDKIVVAPKKWFGQSLSHLSTNDLIPSTWIKI